MNQVVYFSIIMVDYFWVIIYTLEVSVRQERCFYRINHFTYFMQYDFG